MKSIINFVAVIFVVAIMALILAGGYFGIEYLWGVYEKLALDARIILLTSVVTVLIAALIIYSSVKQAARKIINGHLTEQKYVLYQNILANFEQVLFSSESITENEIDELAEEIEDIKSQLYLLASTSTMEALKVVEESMVNENAEMNEIIESINKLITNFRTDLGFPKTYSEINDKYISIVEKLSDITENRKQEVQSHIKTL